MAETLLSPPWLRDLRAAGGGTYATRNVGSEL